MPPNGPEPWQRGLAPSREEAFRFGQQSRYAYRAEPSSLSDAIHRNQGITLLLINLSNTTGYNITLQNDINVSLRKSPDLEKRSSFTHRLRKAVSWLGSMPSSDTKKREEYHLTAKDGDLQSKTMLLNGVPLELGNDGSVPVMNPVLVAVDLPVYMAPTSIAFVVLPNFEAKACS
nr:unnamed protein product [Digitaria exilis]